MIQKRVTAVVANLPGQIAKREVDTAVHLLSAPVEGRVIDTKQSPGPGNVVMIEIETDGVTEIFTAFGEVGITAENVAKEAVREARDYLVSDAIAGEHLTDQLLLPFALAGEGSFTASKFNRHAATNMEIIQRFLRARFETEACDRHIRVKVNLGV